MKFNFLRIIIRSLELGLKVIYIDEVGFGLENNNFFTWKSENQLIIGGPKNNSKAKINAISAVDDDGVIFTFF